MHAFNLAEYVLAAGAENPDRVALEIVAPDGAVATWRYDRLIAAVRGTATGLLASGLVPGNIVLMRLGNTPDFPIAYLGALAAGLVPVPTAAALTQVEVQGIIESLNPKCILHDPAVAAPAAPQIVALEDLRKMYALSAAPWHREDAERLGYIIYTSGTSGRPSAVMHAHRAILARQMMIKDWYAMQPSDRVMHAGAFNWTYTLGTGLMDPWTLGARAVIPEPGTPATALPALMAQTDATIFAAAPGVYRQMLRAETFPKLPSLRHGLSAGEKMAEPIRQGWHKATGCAVYEAFGMSECSTFISSCPERPAAPGAIGMPQRGRQVEVLSEGSPVPRGTSGTIAIHKSDPGLMLGYFDAPEATAARFEGEWFLTGDQGIMDDAGQVTYLGRNDDMMNAGGFRVSPLEIEAVLSALPGIERVAVTEVAVASGASIIAAFYTGPVPLNLDVLETHARERLARYKQPRLYRHLPVLPTGANGKLQRSLLRRTFEAENDQSHQA